MTNWTDTTAHPASGRVCPLGCLLVGLALLLSAAGCGPPRDRGERNPYYRLGRRLAEEGHPEKAAAAYNKALRMDPDNAQAHLQLGLLCEDHFDDPLGAAFHYRSFLHSKPQSEHADVVRRWLERTRRKLREELTPTAEPTAEPTPAEAHLERELELAREREKLMRRQLSELADQLQETRRQFENLQQKTDRRAETGAPQEPPPAIPAPPDAAEPAPLPRVHIVQAGDSLSKLARRYYGSLRYWPRLQQANRQLLGDSETLRVGMELMIPPLEELQQLRSQDNIPGTSGEPDG